MKSFLTITIVIIAIIFSNRDLKAQITEGIFMIKNIDSTSNYYLIRAVSNENTNDSILIISSKVTCSDSKKYQAIQLKSIYHFNLEPFLDKKSSDNMAPIPKEQFALRLDNVVVWRNEKYYPFKSLNLKGLHYKEKE